MEFHYDADYQYQVIQNLISREKTEFKLISHKLITLMLNLIEKRQTNQITFQAEIQNAALWQSSHLIYRPQDDASALQVIPRVFSSVSKVQIPGISDVDPRADQSFCSTSSSNSTSSREKFFPDNGALERRKQRRIRCDHVIKICS